MLNIKIKIITAIIHLKKGVTKAFTFFIYKLASEV